MHEVRRMQQAAGCDDVRNGFGARILEPNDLLKLEFQRGLGFHADRSSFLDSHFVLRFTVKVEGKGAMDDAPGHDFHLGRA